MKNGTRLAVLYCVILTLTLLTVHFASRAVTTIAENLPVHRRTLLIDAGHGGVDGGATSCTGIPEKEYNLSISLRLRDLLELLGCKTRMIRTTDVSVATQGQTIAEKKRSDLKNRLEMSREGETAVFLSIHQNYFPDSQYFGAQVFYAPTPGSEALAQTLQSAFAWELGSPSSRKSKPCQGVWLMERLECTGVLIECGFLSNPQEEARLASGDYQKKLCCVIASTVAQTLADA